MDSDFPNRDQRLIALWDGIVTVLLEALSNPDKRPKASLLAVACKFLVDNRYTLKDRPELLHSQPAVHSIEDELKRRGIQLPEFDDDGSDLNKPSTLQDPSDSSSKTPKKPTRLTIPPIDRSKLH